MNKTDTTKGRIDPMCACRGGPCAECEEGQRVAYGPRPLMPWNDEHPCFVGDFDSPDPFDHDFKYEDTSQGDEIYFQQSGHMECHNCGHCEAADGWHDDSSPEDYL